MIPEFERGLLVAFLRLNLTDAQQEIMSKFYPEIVELCGFKPVFKHGLPIGFFQALYDLAVVQDKRISAIKELRTWAIENHGPNHALASLRGAKDFIDEHFPRPTVPGYS